MPLPPYEKLGVFYLGRRYDPEEQRSTPDLVLYEARRLVTHGLIVGMTGSGKTGLGIALLEEAALDGIPALVIDPKGDLANLCLTFPELRSDDFAPWIDAEASRRQGWSPVEYAAQQAELWRHGLREWDQDGSRLRRLRAAARFRVYTPGSDAGWPLALLTSFAAPPPGTRDDAEWLRERVMSTVPGLLGLAGIEADPVNSREAVLLGHLLQHAWAQGRDLDLATLIQSVQDPPVTRLGVLDLESFYPASERFSLVVQLNNVLAAPGFEAWRKGEPLDIAKLLHTPGGQPQVAVLSIAHLGEAERMCFVTQLLNEAVAWMRSQPGTTSLRALLYMDEIFGFFPPIASPPSKRPLLTLLKQARAYGLGVVLATQNPVDLDYKGLANIGTWFIGRLQTERDRARILAGLEGAAGDQGAGFDRGAAERVLASLRSRVFLLHNVHEEGEAELFESRWTMSYLCGPLTRQQIRTLTDLERRAEEPEPVAVQAPAAGDVVPTNRPPAIALEIGGTTAGQRPVLPPEIAQLSLPLPRPVPSGATPVYAPRLLGVARVRFADDRRKVDESRDVVVLAEIKEGPVPVDWNSGQRLEITVGQLDKPAADAVYAAVPAAALLPKNYAAWSREFGRWLLAHERLSLRRSIALDVISVPGEDERAFGARLQQAAREARDAATARLRARYAPRLANLQERLRRAEAGRQREAQQAARARFDTVISLGSTLLGAFLGRRAISSGTLGRAATTVRHAGRAYEQSADVGRADDSVEAVQRHIQDLEQEFQAEADGLTASLDPAGPLEAIELRPVRGGVAVQLVALAWMPSALRTAGGLIPLPG